MPDRSQSIKQTNIFLIASLAVLAFGIIGIPDIWISKSDLTQISGKLDSAKSTVSWEFKKKRRQPNGVDKFHTSKLFFKLQGSEQNFILTENIGEHYINDKFEKILRALESADSITVWIRSTETSLDEPKVYGIDCDQDHSLEFHPLHLENRIPTPILLVMGLFLITIAAIRRRQLANGSVA